MDIYLLPVAHRQAKPIHQLTIKPTKNTNAKPAENPRPVKINKILEMTNFFHMKHSQLNQTQEIKESQNEVYTIQS